MRKNEIPKEMPEFKSDEERAEFFETYSALDLLDAGLMEEAPEVTYTRKTKKNKQLNIRVDQEILNQLKELASKKGMGYHTLARMWILEKLQQETLHR